MRRWGAAAWLFLFQVTLLLTLITRLEAASYFVNTAAQFNAAVDKNGSSFPTLLSCDRIYLKGGNWAGLVRTRTGSMSDAEAQANPAVVYACDTDYTPKPGGVIVDGNSRISLSSTGIVFAGITFSPKSGMSEAGPYTDHSGNDTAAYLLRLSPGSRNMTVSHVRFDYCGRDKVDYLNNDHYGAGILVSGFAHPIQYCETAGRDFDPNDINIADPRSKSPSAKLPSRSTRTTPSTSITATTPSAITILANGRFPKAETWRAAYFGNSTNTGSAADTADLDGDGFTNAHAYTLGTIPLTTSRDDLLALAFKASGLTLGCKVVLTSGPGYAGLTRFYSVEITGSLSTLSVWTDLPGFFALNGSGQTVTISRPFHATAHFNGFEAGFNKHPPCALLF